MTASRIDATRAIREVVEFFGPPMERLAGTTHAPVAGSASGLVVCPSVCSDFLRNYRREVVLARDLAAQGVTVQRFHYRGTGNSDGESTDITFSSMCDDARSATARLVATGIGRLAFLGTRLGALVAAAVAREHPGAPLVLLDPVLDPAAFFREGFRARMASGARQGGQRATTTEELLAELREQGTIDVLGHAVDQPLYETACARSLVQELGQTPRPLLLVQFGSTNGLRPPYQALVDDLCAQGFTVETDSLGELMAWWFLDDQTGPGQNALGGVAAWLSALLLHPVAL